MKPNKARVRPSHRLGYLYWVAAVLVALVAVSASVSAEAPPGSGACQTSSIAVPNDDNDADSPLQVTVFEPCGLIPVGESFVVSIITASEESSYDVTPATIEFMSGCSILNEGNESALNDHQYSAWYEFMMDSDVCRIVFHTESLSGSILSPSDEMHVFVPVNVAGYELMDVGQAPSDGLGVFWVPLLVVGGMLMWFGNRSSEKHPVWLFAVLITFLAVLTVAIPSIPVDAAVPARYWAIGVSAVTLLVVTIAALLNARNKP